MGHFDNTELPQNKWRLEVSKINIPVDHVEDTDDGVFYYTHYRRAVY